MSNMKCWTNGTDTYIAESVSDIKTLWAQMNGYSEDSPYLDADFGQWRPVRGGETIKVVDNEGDLRRLLRNNIFIPIPDDCSIIVSATASDWAKMGRGRAMFLCSTEY